MGLREDVSREPVSVLPMRQLVRIRPGTRVRLAVAQMQQTQVGSVIVVDEQDRPTGRFTERLLVRLLASDPSQLDDPIENHMTEVGACVKTTDPIVCVIECMQQSNQRFVCVTDERGQICGLTGQKSVMEYIAEHFPRQVKVQLMESKLHMDHREGA